MSGTQYQFSPTPLAPDTFRIAKNQILINRPVVILLLCLIVLALTLFASRAKDDAKEDQLGDYLRKLRYEPVVYTRGEQNHSLLEAQIHGKKLIFMVDTGALTLLDPHSVSELKTLGEWGVTLEDRRIGNITNSTVVLVDELIIGRAHFYNQPSLFRPLKLGFAGTHVDGLLGLDFLIRNYCVLDCGRRRIFLRGGPPSEAESKALEDTFRRSGFAQVNINTNTLATVDIEINELPIRLLVDTGAAFSLLDQPQLKRLKLATVRQQQAQSGTVFPLNDVAGSLSGGTGLSQHQFRVATANNVKIGERIWREVNFGIADLSDWGIGKKDSIVSDVQGMLGSDLLIGYGALIDFGTSKLWLRPAKKS